jgi:ABC-type nitrate/sulfonate/bicarbonate transport system permease component
VGLSRRAQWAPPVVAVLLLLALWEAVVRAGLIPETSIPPATSAIGELASQVTQAAMWKAVGNTLQGWVIGLGLAVLLGVPAGILIGSSRWAYRALRVPIEFLRPIPSVALIPLAVLVYGTGLQSKVFLATFASFWPLLIRLWRITVPSAVPYIATGIRIASAVALILCVTAELVIGSAGLGREINSASSGGNVDLMYAMIIATGLLGWLLNIAATMVERRVLHWHPSQRGVPA